MCERAAAAFAKELAAEVRNARNAPLNEFHSDASSNDAPCGGTQEKTTTGNLKRLGREGNRERVSPSKCWAMTRNSVAISINANLTMISLRSRPSLRKSSAFR